MNDMSDDMSEGNISIGNKNFKSDHLSSVDEIFNDLPKPSFLSFNSKPKMSAMSSTDSHIFMGFSSGDIYAVSLNSI